jgi:hypothetical protein
MKVDNTLLNYIVSQLLLWFLMGIAIFIPHLDRFFTTNIRFAFFSGYLVVQFFYYTVHWIVLGYNVIQWENGLGGSGGLKRIFGVQMHGF